MSLVDTTNPGQPIHHRCDQLEAAFLRFVDDKGFGTEKKKKKKRKLAKTRKRSQG